MKEILLPELAESVVEGEILKWLVAEGDTITAEQPLCEVMTDKVTVELPSPVAGVVHKRLANVGDVVPVHSVIALIEEVGTVPADALPVHAAEEREQVGGKAEEDTGDGDSGGSDSGGSIVEARHIATSADDGEMLRRIFGTAGKFAPAPSAPATPAQPTPAQSTPIQPTPEGRILAVPAARQLARERGLDLRDVRGSGPNGRIRVEDVQAHQNQPSQPAPTSTSHKPQATSPQLPVPPVQYRTPKGYEHLETRVPLRGMRRAISNQMLASHLYTVRTLTVDEVNMTRLVELRQRVKDEARAQGVKLSYLPFIFKAVAVALRKFPSLNSSFDEATQEIVQKNYYHMGMAVATDAGLTVPVIRDVNHKSLFELAREVVEVAGRAQAGKLRADELAGSTFSITNIGTIGALFSFPIINVPDAAILGIHSITRRPVVDEYDQIVVADMMYLSLSFDHRLVDGADAARFCKEVIRLLENPDRLMLEA